jgi:putative ATPase
MTARRRDAHPGDGDAPDDDGLGFGGGPAAGDDVPASPRGRAAKPPLADRMRPRTLAEVVGQDAAVGPGSFLRTSVEAGEVPSVVLWGPPGSGKTTIARALAGTGGAAFVALSAVTSGVKDVRAVVEEAQERRRRGGATLLFVDEIHRFHRGQQDAFLPHVEAGTVSLVGATTENPAFALTPALLSRLRVVVLEPLSREALEAIVDRARKDPERGVGGDVSFEPGAREALVAIAGGDARRLLNALEAAAARAAKRGGPITADDVRAGAQRRLAAYDRGGDVAYDMLSAFHKSLRGSDADAALYWMARILDGGEDPLVLVRRMVAMAAEDVGLADKDALRVALEAKDAVQYLGLPEGELAMVRAVIYLATAPKSNAVVLALERAHEVSKEHPDAPVPLHLRNAPTPFAKSLGHGKGYAYAHDQPGSAVPHAHLPEAVEGTRIYVPVETGDERETAKRHAWWTEARARAARDARAAREGGDAS